MIVFVVTWLDIEGDQPNCHVYKSRKNAEELYKAIRKDVFSNRYVFFHQAVVNA